MGEQLSGLTEMPVPVFVRRQFCLFADDGGLLANVYITRPDDDCTGGAADFFRLVADGCEAYARGKLAEHAAGCYASDGDARKRYNFKRFIYRCEMRVTCRVGGLLCVLVQTRLERGGEVMAAGQLARIFTQSGMLPPRRLSPGRTLRRGAELLLDRSGVPYLSVPGEKPGVYTAITLSKEKATRNARRAADNKD